jgi:signal transduction histidine kinase/ActR/RegA family two-component response regulator
MKEAKIPKNEEERLKELRRYEVLDTLPEADFDDFTRIASYICGTPIALISLVDESRQWFKSKHGLGAPETPRSIAFCSHAILQDGVFVIPDSFKDERFHDNPLATAAPDVRFYAGAPLKTASGYNVGTLCVIDNKPKKIDQKQIEALETLARQVVNLLELRLAKKVSEKELECKSSFFANMSHEIRTPLNGVLGFTSLLLDEKLSKEAHGHVQHIKECGESLLMVINDILDLSKIEAGKLNIDHVPMDLEKTIETAIFVFHKTVTEKGITINYKVSNEVPKVISGDPLRLRQVLLNLIGNAVKFTDKGFINIDVSLNHENSSEGINLLVRVEDSGIGIPSHAIGRLFNSFEQADSSTTRKYGGTGLGLAICSKLVSLMGGKIWVESEDGKGSTFSFIFELQEASVLGESEELGTMSIDYGSEPPGHKVEILVAEDNKINQILVGKILKKLGYGSIDFVENGKKAIEAIQNKEYDLVLMDVQMPEMGGYEATKIIKTKINNDLKIVGLSANVFDEDKLKAKEVGMDDYLEKPINVQKMFKIMEEILKAKRAA